MLLSISYFILWLLGDTKSETDLALNKPATASSIFNYGPHVVNDGDSGTAWSSGSCFSVAVGDNDPWWQVDLQVAVKVTKVKATTRSDCCFDLYDEIPSLYPLSSSKLCYFYSGSVSTPGATATVPCSRPVTGRFVRIHGRNTLNYDDVLQMCDIQVFGVTMNTHFNSCASLVQYKRKQFNKTPTKTITVDSAASCASECERWEFCSGFNIRHLPDVTCELLQGETIDSLQSDPTRDSYLYHACFSVCE